MFVGFLSTFTSGWPSSSSFVVVVYLDRARPLSSLLLFTVTPLFWGGSSLPSDSRLRSASFLFILTGYGRRSSVSELILLCFISIFAKPLLALTAASRLLDRRRRRSLPLFALTLTNSFAYCESFVHTIKTLACSDDVRDSVFHRKQKISSFQLLPRLWRLPSSKLVKLGLVCWWGTTLCYSKNRPTSKNSSRWGSNAPLVMLYLALCPSTLYCDIIFQKWLLFCTQKYHNLKKWFEIAFTLSSELHTQ